MPERGDDDRQIVNAAQKAVDPVLVRTGRVVRHRGEQDRQPHQQEGTPVEKRGGRGGRLVVHARPSINGCRTFECDRRS